MSAFCGNLRVDLTAIRENYRILDARTALSCETAAAVKADAYGLGAIPCAKALYEAGCRTFFVATPEEGAELRPHLPEHAAIAILHGYDASYHNEYKNFHLVPVLNSLPQIKEYAGSVNKGPAILHFDTGMNRLGLEKSEADSLIENRSLLEKLKILLVMSHLASSEEPANPKNTEQAERFLKITKKYQGTRRSLCNSSAIFTDKSWHLDLTRPGMALYGLNPTPESKNPMQRVVTLDAPVLQVRKAGSGETAGYNATYRIEKKTRLAVVGIGYADGFLRSLGNAGKLYWKGYSLPVSGRVSMDLVICDLTAVPEHELPVPGDRLEIIGPNQSADELAKTAGTIGYEILTALGKRYKRTYTDNRVY